MKRVTDSIVQISGMSVNAFILEVGGGQLAVVDAGMPGMHNKILAAVAEMGYTPSDVTDILITHADIDHIGSLKKLAEATGAAIHAGEMSAELMANVQAPSHGSAVMGFFMGLTQKILLSPLHVDHTYGDGDIIPVGDGIQVIETPGHTPDHISFYWQGALMAGDLFFNMGSSPTLTPALMSWDAQAARSSATEALATEPQIVCVGHGDWLDDLSGLMSL